MLFMGGLAVAQVDILDQYKWENRIILLFAPSAANELYQEQFELLQAAEVGVLERDLKVFSVFANGGTQGNEALTQQDIDTLRSAYEVADEFLFILIGKDGGVKNRSPKVVKMSELFAQIDTMPMRQREMNRP